MMDLLIWTVASLLFLMVLLPWYLAYLTYVLGMFWTMGKHKGFIKIMSDPTYRRNLNE